MSDYVFDFANWLMWQQILFWTVAIIGFISSLFAFGTYKFSNRTNTMLFSITLFIVMSVLMGLFPIEWGYGTDRANYANGFLSFKNGTAHIEPQKGEIGFQIIKYIFSFFVNATEFMYCMALIYLTNYFIAIKRLVNGQSYWLFIAVVLSMGFVSYNVNTLRAGIAISFLVLGLSLHKLLSKMIICIVLASSIHTSTIIPGCMLLLCRFYNNTRLFYGLWLLSIPISFIAGNFFNVLFEGMGADDRTAYLTTQNTHYNVGFRIDFIIYSFVPMLVGGYYILKKGIKDHFYVMIYNAYLLTNMFWIFVIRANYSDRFAYLSWFMIPFILVYPLLTHKMSLREGTWLGSILLGETVFGFLI